MDSDDIPLPWYLNSLEELANILCQLNLNFLSIHPVFSSSPFFNLFPFYLLPAILLEFRTLELERTIRDSLVQGLFPCRALESPGELFTHYRYLGSTTDQFIRISDMGIFKSLPSDSNVMSGLEH